MCVRQRDRPISAAAFAGGAYWLAHTAVDWNWNVPAASIPFFVLLGIGAARGDRIPAPRRRSLVAAGVVVAVAVLGFAPVWLSGNLVRQAFFAPAGASRDLRLAERLDPLSPDPYVMQGRVERDPAARVKAIAQAVRMEPKRFDLHYQLGVAYLNARRRPDAARELRTAARLDPRNAKLYLGLLRRPR
jgi:cytochrome c-type biogenesis protein CcmH/NrfG